MRSISDNLQAHNRQQERYFSRTLKRTMLPVGTRYLRRHVEEVLAFGPIRPGDRVLEVGCGMGRYTFLLARQGVRVEGLDLSAALLERFRAFDGGRYNIPIHCADLVQYPGKLAGTFDAVVGFFTMHHVHDLGLCFEAIRSMLKPGGRVVILEPNPYNPMYYVQILITPGMSWQGERGLLRMRPHLIRRAMGEAGFSRISMYRFGFFPPMLTNRVLGAELEAVLERVPVWRSLLPFQLFRGVLG